MAVRDIWFVWSNTDKTEKCVAPWPGIEPWTLGFPLCATKWQILGMEFTRQLLAIAYFRWWILCRPSVHPALHPAPGHKIREQAGKKLSAYLAANWISLHFLNGLGWDGRAAICQVWFRRIPHCTPPWNWIAHFLGNARPGVGWCGQVGLPLCQPLPAPLRQLAKTVDTALHTIIYYVILPLLPFIAKPTPQLLPALPPAETDSWKEVQVWSCCFLCIAFTQPTRE